MINRTIEDNKYLISQYPFISLYTPEEEPYYDRTQLDFIPDGWKDFVLKMCQEIADYLTEKKVPLNEFCIADMKEKWGKLYIYPCWQLSEDTPKEVPDHVDSIIDKYHEKSAHVCIICGMDNTPVLDIGWIVPLCEDCFYNNEDLSISKKMKYQAFIVR